MIIYWFELKTAQSHDKLPIANSTTWFTGFDCLIYQWRLGAVGFSIVLMCVICGVIIIEVGFLLCMKNHWKYE